MSIINDMSRVAHESTTYNVKNRFTPQEICNSMKTTITYIISESFNLTDEETMMTSYRVKSILQYFEHTKPISLPNSVSHELGTRQYSKSLSRRKDGEYLTVAKNTELEPANLEGWVAIVMDMIVTSYNPDIMAEAEIRASFISIFEDLGVGSVKNPRAASYLPNVLRWNAAQKPSFA